MLSNFRGTDRRFTRVLVANRGEIALRVIRAARAAGLGTVAVYSDADRDAPHVRAADAAVHLGPAAASASYLSIPALLQAAQRSGADAVHPGYGFLSERAAFARACAEAGLVFIGPSAEVIELMGRKDSARQVAIDAGVPVIPAVAGEDEAEVMGRALAEVGLPLLVKAAAGGGGKGMRIVHAAADLPEALAAAKREAAAAFGDSTVLIERYVERGRHVEVQILADTHGNVVHLFERDCSTQRRHQKVLEEAPAPTISPAIREVVTTAAVNLARRAGYVNAGTVEFLVDGESAYLLEMNTRLQVEHPVTELITGRDLVDLQFRIAQGEQLPFTQAEVSARGHAIEARVYAEDPDNGFLPQAGRTSAVRWPTRARVDAALGPDQVVATHYDPMLGKIIVHGATREAARAGLLAALDETVILGLTTNLAFLRRLVNSDAFRDATIDTGWLDRNPHALPPGEDSPATWCAAAWLRAGRAAEPGDPFGVADGWRLAGPSAPATVELQLGADRRVLLVDRAAGTVDHDGRSARVHPLGEPAETLGLLDVRLDIDGVSRDLIVAHRDDGLTVVHHGQVFDFAVPTGAAAAAEASSDGTIRAPMPGVVIARHVEDGQSVSAGDPLVVLEAMKMEHALKAPISGTAGKVNATVGAQVVLGQVLLVVTAAENPKASDT
jgi:acetyl/propionyl-CoA carboxylase alpha subunit